MTSRIAWVQLEVELEVEVGEEVEVSFFSFPFRWGH